MGMFNAYKDGFGTRELGWGMVRDWGSDKWSPVRKVRPKRVPRMGLSCRDFSTPFASWQAPKDDEIKSSKRQTRKKGKPATIIQLSLSSGWFVGGTHRFPFLKNIFIWQILDFLYIFCFRWLVLSLCFFLYCYWVWPFVVLGPPVPRKSYIFPLLMRYY